MHCCWQLLTANLLARVSPFRSEFNTVLSGATLAVGTGIFVQGVAAYSFAPVFEGGGCFATPSTASIDCAFEAPAPFSLWVCPAAGGMPAHTCR